jgi:hypothetical protein
VRGGGRKRVGGRERKKGESVWKREEERGEWVKEREKGQSG